MGAVMMFLLAIF